MSQGPKVERRKLRRILKRIPAAFEAGQLRGKGHIKNVSKEGLFVRTTVLPPTGTDVRVIFHDRTGSKIEVHGTVRWTTAQLDKAEKAKVIDTLVTNWRRAMIADITGVPTGTVMSSLWRARSRLRQVLTGLRNGSRAVSSPRIRAANA
jgi:DNA-directed RNA polymerase specialized sigma24 family protein